MIARRGQNMKKARKRAAGPARSIALRTKFIIPWMTERKPTMLAYHNDQAIKDAILARLAAHAMADEFVKGQYWENGKGCAVGCTIHSSNYSEYEHRFGIPQMLAHLEDCIFEGLPNGNAKAWPLRFMSAIEPGRDLSLIG